MKFKFITPDAPEYEAERMLRWEVLKKPLGLPPGSEATPEEGKSVHLVAIEGKRVVGSICFSPESAKAGRIYQMAMSEEYHGHGFARKLLHELEKSLVERGVLNVYVDGESEVFFSQMGYQWEGDIRMRKLLHA